VLQRTVRNQVFPWQIEYLSRSIFSVPLAGMSPRLNHVKTNFRSYVLNDIED